MICIFLRTSGFSSIFFVFFLFWPRCYPWLPTCWLALTQAVSIFTSAFCSGLLCVLATRDSSRKQSRLLLPVFSSPSTPAWLFILAFALALPMHFIIISHQHCCNCKLICRLSFAALHHPVWHTPHATLSCSCRLLPQTNFVVTF